MNPVDTKYHDLLRDSEQCIPQGTRDRLTALRREAVLLSRLPSKPRHQRSWLPFSGVALASMVALMLVWPDIHQPGVDSFPASDPSLSENLEMYQNLDFYYWLSQQGFSNNG